MSEVQSDTFDLGFGLENTHVLITGAAGQIGSVVLKAFIAANCYVSAVDINQSKMTYQHERLRWDLVDVTDESRIEEAFESAARQFGVISTCIALAGLDLSFIEHRSIADMPFSQWQRTTSVNLNVAFLTARTWVRGIRQWQGEMQNVSLILVGSEAGAFGCSKNSDYATSKAGIQTGLVLSMAPDIVAIHPRARVNALAPGPVNTPQFRKECAEDPMARYIESEATVALRQPVPVEAVARTCLFLASDRYSGSITGKVIQVDGGKGGKLFFSSDGTPY